jgi:vancomycin resistance protein YoaR
VPSPPRALLLTAAAVAGVVVLGTGLAVAAGSDQVPRGTHVRSVELAGLSRDEAVERLAGAFSQERAAPVALRAGEELLQLDPAAVDLDLDAEATADAALDAGVLGRLGALVGVEREVEPVPTVDEPALREELARLGEEFDREAREGSVRFSEEGEPVEVMPVAGRELDVEGAAEAVLSSYLSGEVEVPVETTPVRTTEQEVRRAREQIAEPAVAAPVTVDVEGDELVVEPEDIAAALTVEADDDGRLEPRIDAEVLHEKVQGRLRDVGTPPVDATFDTSSGTPVVVPSETGMSVSADDLAEAVGEVLTEEPPRRASAPLSVSQPRISTEQARNLGVKEVIGSFTTSHPCCRPRVQNIHRIADLVDGHVLRPGDQFDLNAFVGPRDKARGFVEAPQILDGRYVDDVGGGISQFVTTLFNAVFFSGLKDVTHTPHSYYISRYPPGREATVSYPRPDFIFENDSQHGVLVRASYTGTSITVTFWGTKRYDEVRSVTGPRTRLRESETVYLEGPDCTPTSGSPGFDIVVQRVLVKDGREVGREKLFTRYKPEPQFVCGPPPERPSPQASGPAPSSSPSPSPSPRRPRSPAPSPAG